MRFGQCSLRYLCLLTLCAALTVWFGLEAGKALIHAHPHGDLYVIFIAGAFAVCLGSFAGGLIGHFVPGAVVGFLSYVPLGVMFLQHWLTS